jgi:hypothetical protein
VKIILDTSFIVGLALRDTALRHLQPELDEGENSPFNDQQIRSLNSAANMHGVRPVDLRATLLRNMIIAAQDKNNPGIEILYHPRLDEEIRTVRAKTEENSPDRKCLDELVAAIKTAGKPFTYSRQDPAETELREAVRKHIRHVPDAHGDQTKFCSKKENHEWIVNRGNTTTDAETFTYALIASRTDDVQIYSIDLDFIVMQHCVSKEGLLTKDRKSLQLISKENIRPQRNQPVAIKTLTTIFRMERKRAQEFLARLDWSRLGEANRELLNQINENRKRKGKPACGRNFFKI